MKKEPPITLSQHMSRAAKARHAKKTPEERSAYAKMMVNAREAKRIPKCMCDHPPVTSSKRNGCACSLHDHTLEPGSQ